MRPEQTISQKHILTKQKIDNLSLIIVQQINFGHFIGVESRNFKHARPIPRSFILVKPYKDRIRLGVDELSHRVLFRVDEQQVAIVGGRDHVGQTRLVPQQLHTIKIK